MVRHFRQRVVLALLALFLCACAQHPATAAPHPSPRPTSTQPVPPPQADAEGPSPCIQIGQTWRSPVDGATLVCVPAGEFVMGAVDDAPRARDDEKPQHSVYLDAFWIDRAEVSNAQFAQCVAEGGCHPREYAPYLGGVSSKTRLDYYENPAYGGYPVLLFNADEAAAYCRWAGRRLPSETEWEKAAWDTDDRTYPWGEGIDCQRASGQARHYFDGQMGFRCALDDRAS